MSGRHHPDTNFKYCGPGGIRTPDLFSAIEARSQLRYRPQTLKRTNCIGETEGCQGRLKLDRVNRPVLISLSVKYRRCQQFNQSGNPTGQDEIRQTTDVVHVRLTAFEMTEEEPATNSVAKPSSRPP